MVYKLLVAPILAISFSMLAFGQKTSTSQAQEMTEKFVALRNAEIFDNTTLIIVTLAGMKYTIALHKVRVEIDPKLDGSYAKIILYDFVSNKDYYIMSRTDSITIFVRTLPQKEQWRKAIKRAIKP